MWGPLTALNRMDSKRPSSFPIGRVRTSSCPQCVGWSRGRLLLEAKAGPMGPSLRGTEINPSFQVGVDAPTVDVGVDVPSAKVGPLGPTLSDFRVKPAAGTSSLDVDPVTSRPGS